MNRASLDVSTKRQRCQACVRSIAKGGFWFAWTLWAILLMAACQPAGYVADNDLPAEPTPIDIAEPIDAAHDFSLPTLNGATVRLSDLRGRWVLVNFWATWCAPCRDEMPYLDRLAVEHADHLTVLAVNMRESEATVRTFVEELDLHLPILLAPDDATLLAYYVRGLPISVLIDPDGSVTQRIVGPVQPGFVEAEIGN